LDSRAAFGPEPESKILKYFLLMLKSDSSSVLSVLKPTRAIAAAVFLFALLIGPITPALAQQDFSLQMGAFSPFAMNPGGSAQSNITLNPLNGFNSSVDLSCTVTSPPGATAPGCVISPASVTPPSTATATVSSVLPAGGTATPGDYTITITGTSGGLLHQDSKDVSVLSVTAQFTITVTAVTAPSSVPAGTGAQATISVNPISGYAGIVTLSCSSITPVVLVPPVCTFDYPAGTTGLQVNGTPATVNLTINTTGPVPTPSHASVSRRVSWALWLPLPMVGIFLLGGAVGGRRVRMSLTFLGIVAIAWVFLILPACGNSSNSTTSTNPNGNTPSNSYTFTLTGVDQNGNISSNTGINNSAATVSLTVTAPAQ